LHEVTAPRRDEWLEKADGDLADEGLELRHSPWREDTAHELPEPIVLRRIGEGGHRRQLQGLRVEALEEDALHGAVGRPVDEGGHDVGEAGQGPEVEVVVAVERGVVPEPAVDRVGVVVEIVREGVQLHGSALSHGSRCGGNPDGLRKETFGAIDVGTQPGACSSSPSLLMRAPLQPTMRISGDVRRPPARFLPSSGASATLAIGRHDDPLERDADRMATRALEGSTPSIARPTRLDPGGPDGQIAAPSPVHAALRTPGQPLDAATRAALEPRFSHDFSGVRIHADGPSADAARSIGATAFTLGSDIVLGVDRTALQGEAGRRLLAHELAHVVQQGSSPSGATLRRDGPPDPPLKEATKEDATEAVAGGLKTVADQASKSEPLKNYGLALAKQYALPIWTRMGTGDKVAAVGTAAAMYGLGVGSLLADPHGRGTLSGINFVAPIGLIPYATLSGFSY